MGYRSYEEQKRLRERYLEHKGINYSMPGTEHHDTGGREMKASIRVSGGPADGKKHQLDRNITFGAKVTIDGKPYIFTQVNGVPTLKYDPS